MLEHANCDSMSEYIAAAAVHLSNVQAGLLASKHRYPLTVDIGFCSQLLNINVLCRPIPFKSKAASSAALV